MNTVKKDRLAFWRLIPWLLGVALVPATNGQTIKRESVPLATEVERTLMRTGMFLQFEARWYDNVPLSKFSAGGDPAESACLSALEDIRTKNYQQFKQIWDIPPKPANSANRPSAGIDVGDTNAWLDGYHTGFDLDHATMVAKIMVGSHSVCVWDANAKSGPVRRAFIVRGNNHAAKVSAVTSETKLEEVILNSLEAARRNPSEYKPVSNFHTRVQYPIPVEGNGSAGEHPVFLQIDGLPVDFDLAQKAPSPISDAVLEFYQRAYAANNAATPDALRSMFTERSASVLKQWTEREQATAKDNKATVYSEHAFLEPRYVKFVVHGDPVSLVVVSDESGKAWHPDRASYRYVVKDPASGQYQLANLGYNNALDQLFHSNLFDIKVLRAPQADVKPAVAKAKAKKTT